MKAIIVGGGIGGLTTALMLRARGIGCELFEQADTIRELGVGINTLPHAIRELAGLGLLQKLDDVAIRTDVLYYLNRHGQEVWRDVRGVERGILVSDFWYTRVLDPRTTVVTARGPRSDRGGPQAPARRSVPPPDPRRPHRRARGPRRRHHGSGVGAVPGEPVGESVTPVAGSSEQRSGGECRECGKGSMHAVTSKRTQ